MIAFDTARITLVVSGFVAAFVMALITPKATDSFHQNLYQAIMMPPTHQTAFQWSKNTCGWHSGSCLANPVPDGPALDWGYYNGYVYDYNVRFRGFFYRNNTPPSNGYLILLVTQFAKGSTVCDHTKAEVIEIQPWRTRFRMNYLHTNYYSVSGNLTVDGSGIGAFNSPNVAYMINDTGCPWQPYNTHVWAEQVSLSLYQENRATYPQGNNGGAGLVTNNYEPNQTHKIQFWQGHVGDPSVFP